MLGVLGSGSNSDDHRRVLKLNLTSIRFDGDLGARVSRVPSAN